MDCHCASRELNVHHQYYVKDRKPWDYPDFALVTLCAKCHAERHEDEERWIEGGGTKLMEWEQQLDMIFGGNPAEAWRFWNVAKTIKAACDKGHERAYVFQIIERALRDELRIDPLPADPK